MARRRRLSTAVVVIAMVAITRGQVPPQSAPVFPTPGATPEAVADAENFPFLPPLPGARLISTKLIHEPLELRSATADSEAVLAGMSYVQKTYALSTSLRAGRPGGQTAMVFISAFRDALFAAGWKLIDVTRLEPVAGPPETVNVAAYYAANDRLIFARMSQEPDGPYQVNVADVGSEDWQAALANDCRVRAYSIQFDLDRPSLRSEATPALQKLAAALKGRSGPTVEIQGHSDNIGPAGDAARQLLSEARARAVMAWLVEHGVPAGRLSSKGYGKTRPIAANDSDLGRAMNRRIEIVRTGCSR